MFDVEGLGYVRSRGEFDFHPPQLHHLRLWYIYLSYNTIFSLKAASVRCCQIRGAGCSYTTIRTSSWPHHRPQHPPNTHLIHLSPTPKSAHPLTCQEVPLINAKNELQSTPRPQLIPCARRHSHQRNRPSTPVSVAQVLTAISQLSQEGEVWLPLELRNE